MLKVECESCRAPYQVDERRVPPTGLKMRCPKCGHTFLVQGTGGTSGASGGGGPVRKQTMVGMAAGGGAVSGPPVAAAPQAAPAAAAASQVAAPPAAFGMQDLPAPKGSPTQLGFGAPARPAPPPPTKGTLTDFGAFGGINLEELDLPALADDVGLPKPQVPSGALQPMAPMAPMGPARTLDFEADLPAPRVQGPSAGGGFGVLDDLPSVPQNRPQGFGGPGPQNFKGRPVTQQFGQPSATAAGPSPMARVTGAGGGGTAVMQAPARPTQGGLGGVELDLPSLQADLLLPANVSGVGLPVVQQMLPSTVEGSGLPTATALVGLPTPAGNLPSNVFGGGLPSNVVGGGLPSNVVGGGLPSNVFGGGLPAQVSSLPTHVQGTVLPSAAYGGGLPAPVAGGGLPAALGGDGLVNFGEFELPQDQGGSVPIDDKVGGVGFGDRNLGAVDASPVQARTTAAIAGRESAPGEASVDTVDAKAGATSGRAIHSRRGRGAATQGSRAPKVIGLVVAALILGGAGLQFTAVGAFGHLAISDAVKKNEYNRLTASSAEGARKKMAVDTYSAARAANDELADARKKAPRARALSAYATFSEYASQARFGLDVERSARAKQWIAEFPPSADVQYVVAARAAQEAVTGDPTAARASLAAAIAKAGNDPIAGELELVRGEVELQAKAGAEARTAFSSALALNPGSLGARAQYGLARAAFLLDDRPAAQAAVKATLAASPSHPGARTLKARLLSENDGLDDEALKEVNKLLDPAARANASVSELSQTLAAKGWILSRKDRAGDARAAFEEAVKLDQRNTWALIGQGEIYYADGRYTEALNRFDEALTKEPANLEAIVGSAKTKLGLERLKDAKKQLTDAFAAYPKHMRFALWLGKVEQALGNKPQAEAHYTKATELASPKQPDAVQPYAALASLLAQQGRVQEAAAKLELAKSKLPDSTTLQRALGEVAAAQGRYDEAVAHFELALQKDPEDVGSRLRLAVVLRKMRNLTAAAVEFDKVYAQDRDYPGLALERGLLYEESGQVEKALEQFKSAQAKAPQDLDLRLRVGAALAALGSLDEAIPMLKQVLEQRMNSPEANHYMGRAYLKKGGLDIQTAMKYLMRAVDLDPNRSDYHLYVAWAANESIPVQMSVAIEHVDRALELDKMNADAYWQRGVVERKRREVKTAIKDLKKALELKPSRIEAHAALAECYEDSNDVASALAEWQQALSGPVKPPFWQYRYGKMLMDRGNAAEGARYLQPAAEQGTLIQPRPGWVPDAHFQAAEALRKTGKKPAAIEHYKLFLQMAVPNDPDFKDARRALVQLGARPDD